MSKNPPKIPAFLTDLFLVASPRKKDPDGHWYVFAPLVLDSVVAARIITVPEGFPTDLASTPRIPIIYELLGGIGAAAAVVHDYLYTSGRESREVSDKVFLEALELCGVSWPKRQAMYWGVRLGGASHYTTKPAGSPVNP